MSGRQDIEQATKWMRLATSKMQLLSIAPAPENYGIFFHYYANKSGLKEEVEKLLGQAVEFTPEVCADLYARHLEKDSEQLNELKIAIKALIAQLCEQLKDLASDMDGFDQYLASCEASLNAQPDIEALKCLVSSLIKETRQARDTCQASSDVVNQLNREVDNLRSALEQMSEEVLVDALTGIHNRRAFDIEMTKIIASANIKAENFCLLLLDIDNFKIFNDEHGHLVGDMVLRYVAEMIKKGVKGRDVVVRYGGEEFAVILPKTDYEGALSVAHAISDTVAGQNLTVGKDKRSVGNVTLSAGVSEYRKGDNANAIVSRADAGLYAAKGQGRNIVVGERELS